MAQSWLIKGGCPADAIGLPPGMGTKSEDETTTALGRRLMSDGDNFALLSSYTQDDGVLLAAFGCKRAFTLRRLPTPMRRGCRPRGSAAAPGVPLTKVAGVQGMDRSSEVPEEMRAAYLGTRIHSGVVPRLVEVIGGRTVSEFDVKVIEDGLELPGPLDLAKG